MFRIESTNIHQVRSLCTGKYAGHGWKIHSKVLRQEHESVEPMVLFSTARNVAIAHGRWVESIEVASKIVQYGARNFLVSFTDLEEGR